MIRNVIKRFIQIILYLVEVAGMSLAIVILSRRIEPINSIWECIERFVFAYGIYQIAVCVILSNCNDIRKDSYLALLTNYKEVELYIETSDESIKNVVKKNITYQLNPGTLNDKDIRNEYLVMQQILDNKDLKNTRMKIILFEHLVEEATLNWRYSFLLRTLK